jgi:hypothetical protein
MSAKAILTIWVTDHGDQLQAQTRMEPGPAITHLQAVLLDRPFFGTFDAAWLGRRRTYIAASARTDGMGWGSRRSGLTWPIGCLDRAGRRLSGANPRHMLPQRQGRRSVVATCLRK